MNKLYKIPIRMLSIRHSNWKAACQPDYGPVDVQRSVLLNGIGVAAAKTFGAHIGACTIMYQVGSRYETEDCIGASHFLRAASTASGCSFSGFSKMRYLMQHGASLTCTSDRQSIAYTLRCPVTLFSELKCVLLDTARRCCFREWEMDDLKPTIRDDLHRIHPEQRAIDLAQKACWAGPLSNSTYCPPARIDSMTGAALSNYTDCHFKTDHCSVASIGVPFEETIKLAEAIEHTREKPAPRCTAMPRPRAGFELYDLGANSDTWTCLVVPGCGTSDVMNLLKHAIIAHACGTANSKAGSHNLDRIPEYPIGCLAGTDLHATFRAFNISYYDTGVFGIIARSPASTAWRTAMAAADFLSKVGCLDLEQIDVGKQRLKVSLALHDDDSVKVTEGLALQIANNIQIDSAKTTMQWIDSIANEDIKYTAQILADNCRYLALAVVGDIGLVPHEKELVFRR